MIKQSQSAHLDASARSTLFFLDQFSEVFDALFAAGVAAQEGNSDAVVLLEKFFMQTNGAFRVKGVRYHVVDPEAIGLPLIYRDCRRPRRGRRQNQ